MEIDSRQQHEFAVEVDAGRNGAVAVVVRGELDLASASRLRTDLERVIERGDEVVLDLEACGFVDSSGIAAIVTAATRLRDRGRSLKVQGAGELIYKTLEIAGLASIDGIVLEPYGDSS